MALGINYNLYFFISYKRLNGIDNLSCIGNTPFHQGSLPQPIQDKLSKLICFSIIKFDIRHHDEGILNYEIYIYLYKEKYFKQYLQKKNKQFG